MKKSELVEELLKRNKETPLQIYEEGQTQKKIGEPDEKLTNDAYNKICELWNKDEKSRGFIKFLIRSFIPRKPMNKILSFSGAEDAKVRCCILGIKLAGVKEITDAWSPLTVMRMQEHAAMTLEGRDKVSKEYLKKEKKILQDMPVEVRNSTIGYFSDKDNCDKYLSGEAYGALLEFVDDCVFGDEEEIINLLTQMKRAEDRKNAPKADGKTWKKPKEKGGQKTFGFSQFIDEKALEKLKNIK